MGRDLRMREDSSGRGSVFPWSDTPAAAPYAVADVICNNGSPRSYGTVVSVDPEHATISVAWDDGEENYGPITYPADASYLRKAFPWEL